MATRPGSFTWLQQHGRGSPIIMLTGASEETDVVRGLEFWCQRLCRQQLRARRELFARLRAQMRIFDQQGEKAIYPVGPYTYRPAEEEAAAGRGERQGIRLTDKETAVSNSFIAPMRQ